MMAMQGVIDEAGFTTNATSILRDGELPEPVLGPA
jgi:hypothetical protein